MNTGKQILHWCIVLFFILGLIRCTEESATKPAIVIPLSSDPDRLSPMLSATSSASDIYKHIFLPLADYEPNTLQFKPVLLERLPEEVRLDTGLWRGGSVFHCEISNSAQWANHSPVTGYDVAFTIKALFYPKTGATAWKNQLNFIEDIQVDKNNPRKFDIYTSSQHFLDAQAVLNFNIYPAYLFDANQVLNGFTLKSLKNDTTLHSTDLESWVTEFTSPKCSRDTMYMQGSGAYQLKEWIPNQKVILQKVENWWGEKFTATNSLFINHPDQMIFQIMPDETSILNAMRNQEIDAYPGLSPAAMKSMERDQTLSSNYQIIEASIGAYDIILLNNKDQVTSDLAVRKALASCTDVDRMMQVIHGKSATRMVGPYLPEKPYSDPNIPHSNFNPKAAAALLEASGWKIPAGKKIREKKIGGGKGIPCKIRLSVAANNEAAITLATQMQQSALEAGIDMEIDAREFNGISADIKARTYQAAFIKVRSGNIVDDPYANWHSSGAAIGGGNRTAFMNPEADVLMDSIRKPIQDAQRFILYRKLGEIIRAQQPAIFLWTVKNKIAVHKRYSHVQPVQLKPGIVVQWLSPK